MDITTNQMHIFVHENTTKVLKFGTIQKTTFQKAYVMDCYIFLLRSLGISQAPG